MTIWKKAISVTASAALLASLLTTALAGTAFAAISVTPPVNNIIPNNSAQALSIGTVTGIQTTDITSGTLSLTLPAGFSWVTAPTLTATPTGTTTVTVTGTAPNWTLAVTAGGAADTIALAFSGGTVMTGVVNATAQNVTLGGTALVGGVVNVATVTANLTGAAQCTAGITANGPYGTSFAYCTDKTEQSADGTSFIDLRFNGSTPGFIPTVTTITVTGGQFIGGDLQFAAGAATVYNWTYPRTSFTLGTFYNPVVNAGADLFLASSTAGTATVSISYSSGTVVYDSTQSFTFTAATVNVPSTALSTSKVYKAGVAQTNPTSAPKAAGDSSLYMQALVKDNNGNVIPSGVTIEWAVTGPAFFSGGNYKFTGNVSGTTGIATSPNIFSTGAGGTATITSTVKYLGVSYSLPDKTVNFVGDPATITCANSYFSLATGTNQEGIDDGAIECNVQDANKFDIMSGVIFTATNPTPAAFWTTSGVDSWSTKYNDWEVGVACGSTAGTNAANIKATVGTKSVTTTDAITMTCATALDDGANKGTLSLDTSAGTTVQPGGQLAINVVVKDKNGLPAPDGTITTAATNGFGTIVRVIRASNTKGTVNGIAKYVYLAPSTPGTAVVTFFAEGNTTPSNIAVTIGVGQSASQAIPVTIKAGAPTQGALSSSVCEAACSGSYGTATPVVSPGQYISWRGVGGASFAGVKVYIWVAKKNSDGTWGAFTLLTSRIADASGTAFFNWKLTSTGWYSVRFGNADMTVASVARQGRWR